MEQDNASVAHITTSDTYPPTTETKSAVFDQVRIDKDQPKKKDKDRHKHRHKDKSEDGHKHKHRHKHKHDKDTQESEESNEEIVPDGKHRHHHHHHHHSHQENEHKHHRHKHSKTEVPQLLTTKETTTEELNMPNGGSLNEIHLEIISNATTDDKETGRNTMPAPVVPPLMSSIPPPIDFSLTSSLNAASIDTISSAVSTQPVSKEDNNGKEEPVGDGESLDKPESQLNAQASAAPKELTFMEPPMPLEHKKDRLRHHIKLAHKKNTLGETIYKGHPSWLLMRDIQTGLYNNIKTLATRTVDPDLFHTPSVTVLPIVPAAKFTFKFKDYCPMAFFKLREHFGINHVDYVTSLCQNWNEVSTPGKSGSLFFFSLDNQYVLKTIPKREAKILRGLLPAYYEYMTTHPDSLLTRFMGLHRVKPHKGRQVRFLVMGNLFHSNLRVHMRFDLKGSTVGRELSPAERAKKNPTFKDMDFRRLNRRIHLGPNRDLFLKILQEDSDFLSSQHIMDYSLLVGIHFMHQDDEKDASSDEEAEEDVRVEPRTPPLNRSMTSLPPLVPDAETPPPNQALSFFEREQGGVRARLPDGTPMEEYYYIGVIDILMQYSMRKQIEHAAKKLMHPRGEISSVEPSTFAARFMKFAVENVD